MKNRVQIEFSLSFAVESLPKRYSDPCYSWAIYILGGVAALTVIGLILIASWNLTAPDGLVAIGSTSIGGLAGLLAPSLSKSSA